MRRNMTMKHGAVSCRILVTICSITGHLPLEALAEIKLLFNDGIRVLQINGLFAKWEG